MVVLGMVAMTLLLPVFALLVLSGSLLKTGHP
jgi:hypothetical protein